MNDDIRSSPMIKKQISFFEFTDHSRAIIHGLKYYNRPRAARSIVRSALRNCNVMETVLFDAVVPVPLHWYKKLRRGYNQSEIIAKVVAEERLVPTINALKRVKYGRSQTQKGRTARSLGIQKAFAINKNMIDLVKGKSVLLVDDVLTTGATSNICAALLSDMGATEVSLMTIASVTYN